MGRSPAPGKAHVDAIGGESLKAGVVVSDTDSHDVPFRVGEWNSCDTGRRMSHSYRVQLVC